MVFVTETLWLVCECEERKREGQKRRRGREDEDGKRSKWCKCNDESRRYVVAIGFKYSRCVCRYMWLEKMDVEVWKEDSFIKYVEQDLLSPGREFLDPPLETPCHKHLGAISSDEERGWAVEGDEAWCNTEN